VVGYRGSAEEGMLLDYLEDLVKDYLDGLEDYLPTVFDRDYGEDRLPEKAEPSNLAESILKLLEALRDEVKEEN